MPGVTSCIAAPASVGIPVTHRGSADQFLVLSGRGEGGSWPEFPLYSDRRTTVIMMPIARLGTLSDKMIHEANYPKDVPAAIVEKGTCEDERCIEGTLGDIADIAANEGVGSPALLVVGDVVKVLRSSKK